MARIELLNEVLDSRTELSNFGRSINDVVILHIYALSGQYQTSYQADPGDWYIQNTLADGSYSSQPSSAMVIDLEATLSKAGYTGGTFNVRIHCLRQHLIGVPLAAISEDFKEIKITQNDLQESTQDQIGNYTILYQTIYNLHKVREVGEGPKTYTVPLLVDEGRGDITPIINMYADVDPTMENDILGRRLYLKTSRPLISEGIGLVNISTLCSDVIDTQVTLVAPQRQEPFRLMRPNFDVGYDFGSSPNTVKKTWSDILGSGEETSQQLISKYVSASWGEGTELNIDYRDYKNFVHYSCAEERLRNFHYKMSLLEDYRTSNSELRALSSAGTEVTGNIQQNQKKIDGLLNGFDAYEKFMYYGSGSSTEGNVHYKPATWPKYNNAKPYMNISSSDARVKSWFGSSDTGNTNFGGQIYSASVYDRDNQDMLIKALPAFILDDPQNSTIFTYTHMIGQHYDILFNYINHMTSIHSREESPDEGTPRALLFEVAQSLGLQLFNGSIDTDLWSYALGTNQAGTTLQTGQGTTSGSLSTISAKNRTEEIWNRLINNLPALLKSKGTERSVRALINCYGIPSSILRIVEFGGPDSEDQTSNFAINRFANALQFGESGGLRYLSHKQVRRIKADDSHPKAFTGYKPLQSMEMRIRSTYKQNQVLWADNWGSDALVLEYSSSGHSTYPEGTSPYARLVYHTSASWAPGANPYYSSTTTGGHLSASTDYGPLLDGDWWNILLRFPDVSGSSATDWKAQPIQFEVVAKKSAEFSGGGITHTIRGSSPIVSGSTLSAGNNQYWRNYYNMPSGQPYGRQIVGGAPKHGKWAVYKGKDMSDNFYDRFNNKTFSGSMQEYRLWTERLTEASFDQHIQNPNCIVGNHYSSSFYELITRHRMGTDLATNNVSGSLAGSRNELTSSHPQFPFDFGIAGGGSNNAAMNYMSASVYGTTGGTFEDVEETYYIDMPSTLGNRPMSNKIRIEDNRLPKKLHWDGQEYSRLSRDVRKEYSALDTAPLDTNKLGIYLSPTNDVNIDIANVIGNTRLDQFVGDPRDYHKEQYSELADIRKEYFQKHSGPKGIWDYIRQIEFFDGSLFKMVNKFIPNKANELSGLLIEPTILERSKTGHKGRPLLTEDLFPDPAILKSDKWLSTEPVDPFQSASFMIMNGEYLSYSGSITNIRKVDKGFDDYSEDEDQVHHMFTITSSHDVKITDPGTSGDPYELANTQALNNPLKVREVHGYDARTEGSRYHSQQLVVHKGTNGYALGDMSLQLTPIYAREVLLPVITGSRKSAVYESQDYFYSGSVSMSRHEQWLNTGAFRGPYEYSRDFRSPVWIPSNRRYGQNGQFGNHVGSYRSQAYSSSRKPAETNIDASIGLHKASFVGTQLTALDFNKPTKATPDGGPVVEFFETNPNQLFSANEIQPGRGEILLSGELPVSQVSTNTIGGKQGDIIPGSQQSGPQGQTNGYWLNNGYEMVWITASPPNTSWGGKLGKQTGGNTNNTSGK